MRLTHYLKKLSILPNKINMLKPNKDINGMTELCREKFTKQVQIPKICVGGVKVSDVLKYLKPYFLKLQHFKPVQNVGDDIVFMLDPLKVQRWENLNIEHRNALKTFGIDESSFKIENFELKYEHFTAEDILRAVLPPDKEGMASFTKVGHIVHVNLREHLLPFKTLIGNVLLDKVSGCESVVNKINNIDSTYRNFSMEVLCGKNETKTAVKENNCLFEFDFATVYWNSRLSTEHERIVKLVSAGDVLFDVFAGVGPFSIPTAKKKCIVYANDLNPESYFWLNHNAKKNKIDTSKYLQTFNLDGHDFIKTVLRKELLQHVRRKEKIYVVMNLPALATEFLHNFIGMYDSSELKEITNPPTVFVYCFAKGEDYEQITRDLITRSLGIDITHKMTMFRVRTVSSFKEMMRVSFELDEELLIAKKGSKRILEGDEEETLGTKRSMFS